MTIFPLHPIDAMEAIADATPEPCEGSLGHLRGDFAWEVREDYREALAGCVPTGYDHDDMPPLAPEDVVCMCVRDAINACRRWTEGLVA